MSIYLVTKMRKRDRGGLTIDAFENWDIAHAFWKAKIAEVGATYTCDMQTVIVK